MGDATGLEKFMASALAQVGDKFKWGAEHDMDDPDPDRWDASELTEWASAQAGDKLPDGSWRQYKALHREGSTMDVDDALAQPGALVFRFSDDPFEVDGRPRISHVAISLGDGRVLEATTGQDRVVRIHEHGGRFTHAAEIPEYADQQLTADQVQRLIDDPDTALGAATGDGADEPAEEAPTQNVLVDTDGDGLSDKTEGKYGFDPTKKDSDRDGITDDEEFLRRAVNPERRKTFDADGDGLYDPAEEKQGTDPNNPDTDGDGIKDGLEVSLGMNPLVKDPTSSPSGDRDTEHASNEVHQAYGGVQAHFERLEKEAEARRQQESDGETTDGEAGDGQPSPDGQAGASEPLVDSDGDGIADKWEKAYGSDPNSTDTDNDGLPDPVDIILRAGRSIRPQLDTDGDGVYDVAERKYGTDVNNPDTDGDGLLDSAELLLGSDPLVAQKPKDPVPKGGDADGTEEFHRAFQVARAVIHEQRDALGKDSEPAETAPGGANPTEDAAPETTEPAEVPQQSSNEPAPPAGETDQLPDAGNEPVVPPEALVELPPEPDQPPDAGNEPVVPAEALVELPPEPDPAVVAPVPTTELEAPQVEPPPPPPAPEPEPEDFFVEVDDSVAELEA